MLKILQARLQQYVNHELPDVQAGFRKGRGTRDQIANICWFIKKSKRNYKQGEKTTSRMRENNRNETGINFQNKQAAHATQYQKN